MNPLETSRGEDNWPDQDLLVRVATQANLDKRSENVAKANRLFWAKEMLVESVMTRIDWRRKVTRWSTEILKEIVRNVPEVKRTTDLEVATVEIEVEKYDKDFCMEFLKETFTTSSCRVTFLSGPEW